LRQRLKILFIQPESAYHSHMKIIGIPDVVRGLIFDVDLTLYENHTYYNLLSTLLIRRLASHLGQSEEQTEAEIGRIREAYAREHEGRGLSLGNVFLRLGIPIAESARWRAELFEPEKHLQPDPRLVETLFRLAPLYRLGVVTNNARETGLRTLRALGVEHYFECVIGLDTSGESKPAIRPFEMACNALGLPLQECISIGDRLEVDIECPVAHGMGGILVEGINDVYHLPDVLNSP
jgi:HAD superfamily hydrolase (TIGR01549 family)